MKNVKPETDYEGSSQANLAVYQVGEDFGVRGERVLLRGRAVMMSKVELIT